MFGLEEEREGVLVGLAGGAEKGVVLEMEYRRRSGRGVSECFYLPSSTTPNPTPKPILLDDHPSLLAPSSPPPSADQGNEEHGVTFELGITEAQRKVREGVVLPYFDAQRGGGVGGRILYEMGEEDKEDFDEEEDEM